MEKLSDQIYYEKAVFEIRGPEETKISTAVNNRPVRLELSKLPEEERGILLTIRTDDPVPFMIRMKKPSGFSREGFRFYINNRENDSFREEGEEISIDRVWAGKTVIRITF